jgi:ribosome-associated toxin RatA of RatAB toxin-antitoxin module
MRALTAPICAGLLMLTAAWNAPAAEDISVESIRRDDALDIACRATIDAPLDIVWRTLTDYEHLPEFIPGMRSSRVIERRGAEVVVEQSGEARFLFLSYPIEVTVLSTERLPQALEVSLIKGNLKQFHGAYRIEPQGAQRILLTWAGTIEALSMPPLIGALLMRSAIEDQFRGMVSEIERREALRRDKAQGAGR